MPTIHKILATTALCLTAMGVSSCYSSLHKYVWNRAEIIDEAYWVQDEENIELYQWVTPCMPKVLLGPLAVTRKRAGRGIC